MFKKLNAKIAGLGAACIVACALLGSATTISAATHSVALNPQPLPPGKAIVKCAEYGCL